MCSRRLNDRNEPVGDMGTARLKVTRGGQARGSPRRQAEDVPKALSLCVSRPEARWPRRCRGQPEPSPGRREQARGWHGSEPTEGEDESIQLTSPVPWGVAKASNPASSRPGRLNREFPMN